MCGLSLLLDSLDLRTVDFTRSMSARREERANERERESSCEERISDQSMPFSDHAEGLFSSRCSSLDITVEGQQVRYQAAPSAQVLAVAVLK